MRLVTGTNNYNNTNKNKNRQQSGFIRQKFLRSTRLKTSTCTNHNRKNPVVGGKSKIVDLPKGFAPSFHKAGSGTLATASETLSSASIPHTIATTQTHHSSYTSSSRHECYDARNTQSQQYSNINTGKDYSSLTHTMFFQNVTYTLKTLALSKTLFFS